MKRLLVLMLLTVFVGGAAGLELTEHPTRKLQDKTTWQAMGEMIRERMAVSNQDKPEGWDYYGNWHDTYFGVLGADGMPNLAVPVRTSPAGLYLPRETNHIYRAYIGPYGGQSIQPNVTNSPGYWPLNHVPVPWLVMEAHTLVKAVMNPDGVAWVTNSAAWDGADPGDVQFMPTALNAYSDNGYVRRLLREIDLEASSVLVNANVGPGQAVWTNYLPGHLTLTNYPLPAVTVPIPYPAAWFTGDLDAAGYGLGVGFYLAGGRVIQKDFHAVIVSGSEASGRSVLIPDPIIGWQPTGRFDGTYVWSGTGFVDPYSGRTIRLIGDRVVVSGYELDTGVTISYGSLPACQVASYNETPYAAPKGAFLVPAVATAGGFTVYSNSNWVVDHTGVQYKRTDTGVWEYAPGTYTPVYSPYGASDPSGEYRASVLYYDGVYWGTRSQYIDVGVPWLAVNPPALGFEPVAAYRDGAYGWPSSIADERADAVYSLVESALLVPGALDTYYIPSGTIPTLEGTRFRLRGDVAYTSWFVKSTGIEHGDIIGDWIPDDHAYVLNDYRAAKYTGPTFTTHPAFRPFIGTTRRRSVVSDSIRLGELTLRTKLVVEGGGAPGEYVPPYYATGATLDEDGDVVAVSGWADNPIGVDYPQFSGVPDRWLNIYGHGWTPFLRIHRDHSDPTSTWRYRDCQYTAYTTGAVYRFTGGYEGAFDLDIPYPSYMPGAPMHGDPVINLTGKWDGAFADTFRVPNAGYPDYGTYYLKLFSSMDNYGGGEPIPAVLVSTPYWGGGWHAWQLDAANARWRDLRADYVGGALYTTRTNPASLKIISRPVPVGTDTVLKQMYGIVPDTDDSISVDVFSGTPPADIAGRYVPEWVPEPWEGIDNLQPDMSYSFEHADGAYTLDLTMHPEWPATLSSLRYPRVFIDADGIDTNLTGRYDSLVEWAMLAAEHTNSYSTIWVNQEPATLSYALYANVAALSDDYPLPAITVEPSSGEYTNATPLAELVVTWGAYTPNLGPLVSDAFLYVSYGDAEEWYPREFGLYAGDGAAGSRVVVVPVTTNAAGSSVSIRMVRIIADASLDSTYHRQESAAVDLTLFNSSGSDYVDTPPAHVPEFTGWFDDTQTPYYTARGYIDTGDNRDDFWVYYDGNTYPYGVSFPYVPREPGGLVGLRGWSSTFGPYGYFGQLDGLFENLYRGTHGPLPVVGPGAHISATGTLTVRNLPGGAVYATIDDTTTTEIGSEPLVYLPLTPGWHTVRVESVRVYGSSDYLSGDVSIQSDLLTNGVVVGFGTEIMPTPESLVGTYPIPKEYRLYGWTQPGDDFDTDKDLGGRAYAYAYVYTNTQPRALAGVYEPVDAGGAVTGRFVVSANYWYRDNDVPEGEYIPTAGISPTGTARVAVMDHLIDAHADPLAGMSTLASGVSTNRSITNLYSTGAINVKGDGMTVNNDRITGPASLYPAPGVATLPGKYAPTSLMYLDAGDSEYTADPARITVYGMYTNGVYTNIVWHDPRGLYWEALTLELTMLTAAASVTSVNSLQQSALRIASSALSADVTVTHAASGTVATTYYTVLTELTEAPAGIALDSASSRLGGRQAPPAAAPYVEFRPEDEPPRLVAGANPAIVEAAEEWLLVPFESGDPAVISYYHSHWNTEFGYAVFNIADQVGSPPAPLKPYGDAGNGDWVALGWVGFEYEPATGTLLAPEGISRSRVFLGNYVVVDFTGMSTVSKPGGYDEAVTP